MTLSDLIKDYRNNHGLSQRQFASQCDLSNAYISMLENNKNPRTGEPIIPQFANLVKIASGMRLSIDALLSIVDDIPIKISSVDESLSVKETAILYKYRELDSFGKRTVETVLDTEYDRCTASLLMAAHNDKAEDPEELDLMRQDAERLSRY